jgi:MFS family permease
MGTGVTNSSDQKGASTSVLHQPVLFGSLALTFLLFGLPIYGKSLGASALAIGGLFSVFTMTMTVLRPLVGWAVDHFGRRAFIVIGLASYAAAMALFALATSLGGLYLARIVQGVASSLMGISVITIVADLTSPGDRGKEMGRIIEVQTRGEIIGVFGGFALMSFLSTGIAWRLAFLGYAVMGVLAAGLAWKNVPETRPARPTVAQPRSPLSKQFLKLLLIVFTTGLSAAMIKPIYLIFLQDRFTVHISTLGWAFLPAGIVYALLPSRLGGLSDRFGRVFPMASGLIGAGFLSLLLPRLPNIGWLVVIYTLSAVGWSMADPAEIAMVADVTGGETRGRAYGLYEFAGGLGASLGPLLGGWLYDTAGRTTPFTLNGVVLLGSAIWVLVMLRQPRPNDNQIPVG